MSNDIAARVRAAVRDVPDFPKPGILFKDITPILRDAVLFNDVVDHLTDEFANREIQVVAGIESRGFIFGAPLANALGAAFVPIRKPGKLPAERVRVDYALEYGTDAVEAHADAISPALKTVYDPEIPVDIYELGLIYKVDLDDDRKLTIDMTLTAPGCPVAGEMPGWVENAARGVEGIQDVEVNMVFDPPWDASRMSEEAQVALNWW
jgi:FeS assembly SUF system protein